MKMHWAILIALTTCCFADQEAVYAKIGQYQPGEVVLLRKHVNIQADESWWATLESDGTTPIRSLTGPIQKLAEHMGWPDDGEGKITINITFPPEVTDVGLRRKCLDNMLTVVSSMRNDAVCHPKGDKFVLNLKFDPKASKPRGTFSPDGTTYNFVSQVDSWVMTDAADAFFRGGHK